MRILLMGLVASSCSSGVLREVAPPDGLQQASTSVLTGPVAGSSPTDFWFIEERASPLENRLFHFDGKAWEVKATPLPIQRFASLAVSSPGSVWLQTTQSSGKPVLLKVSADGSVVDRSPDVDLEGIAQGFFVVKGTVYLPFGASAGAPRLYKLVNDQFELLRELPERSGVTLVLSDDDIWVTAAEGPQSVSVSKRWKGGAWVPFDAPTHFQASLTSPTDVWLLKDVVPGETANFTPSNGTELVHFDGVGFRPVALPPYDPRIGRWGIQALAPGVLAVLSTPIREPGTADSYVDLESRRWDGTTLSGPRVLIGHATDCGSSSSHCELLRVPVRATLLDGTLVHSHVKLTLSSKVEFSAGFYFGSPADY